MFGSFRVLHQVGTGTLGPVYRAHDGVEGRLVAIKAFNLELPPDRAHELVDALNDLAARNLSHPSIAEPLAAGLEGAVPWLAQAYVPAESLDVALQQYGPPPAAETLALVTHLAGALDFAAVAGVLHGTLHPRDILVAPDETHVIDLGVAGAFERIGIRPPVRGPYTAPEQAAGGPATRAGDIYALAALAWELLTGQLLPGPDVPEEAVPALAGFDRRALAAAFGSATAADPAERPASALAFAAALRDAVSDPEALSAARAEPVRQPAAFAPAAFQSDNEAQPAAAPETASRDTAPEDELAVSETVSLLGGSADQVVSASGPSLFDGIEESPDADRGRDLRLNASTPPGTESWDHRPPLSGDAGGDHDLSSHAWHPPANPARRAAHAGPSWRLIATVLIVGVILGFGGAYMWLEPASTSGAAEDTAPRGASADPASPAQPLPAQQPAATPAPAGAPAVREYTDNAVPEEPAITSGPIGSAAAASGGAAASAPAAVPRRPPAAAAPAPVRGELTVRSRPAGASVEVNGRRRGETPLTVSDLPLGSYRLRVTRNGYATEQRQVTLSAGRRRQAVDVPLRRVPEPERTQAASAASGSSGAFVGSVLVESHPAGARVFIDGELVGVTPISVAQVAAGSHVVRIDKTGYNRWSSAVRVVSGQRVRVAASLEEEIVR